MSGSSVEGINGIAEVDDSPVGRGGSNVWQNWLAPPKGGTLSVRNTSSFRTSTALPVVTIQQSDDGRRK